MAPLNAVKRKCEIERSMANGWMQTRPIVNVGTGRKTLMPDGDEGIRK